MYNKIKNKLYHKDGFTLIELIVVIAIVAVLAAVGIASISSQASKSVEAAMYENARIIAQTAELMYKDREQLGTANVELLKSDILLEAKMTESEIGTVTINQVNVLDQDGNTISHRIKGVKVEKGALSAVYGIVP